MNDALLNIENLKVYFHSTKGEYKVVDGVTLSIKQNEILGLAGESGSGKSTVVEAIMRLIEPPGYIAEGKITFSPKAVSQQQGKANRSYDDQLEAGVDLVKVNQALLQYLRWRYVSYIPQASMNSLNPIMRIKTQMVDVMQAHSDIQKVEAHARAAEIIDTVGLPERVLDAYPHELSGGMKQRATIAIAMTLNPQLVIADEPTTALDVNVQQAILDAIRKIKEERNATILFVSHDLAVHAQLVDRMAIMYAGKVVEINTVEEIFDNPMHPYTQQLINAIPVLGGPRKRVETALGQTLDRLNWPTGCRFHTRCPHVMAHCKTVDPELSQLKAEHHVACHLYNDHQTEEQISQVTDA